MSRRKSGTIINISSISDRKTSPAAIAYTAAKYGVRAAGESLREAEGKNGVRVINIAPGYVKTNIHAAMGVSFEHIARFSATPSSCPPKSSPESCSSAGSSRNRSASATLSWRPRAQASDSKPASCGIAGGPDIGARSPLARGDRAIESRASRLDLERRAPAR
jgi:short-subunit dehydrogenase